MKKDWIRHRNNKLETDLAELKKEIGEEKIKKFMADAETHQFGFYCYKRGLRDRGQEVLRDEEDDHIFSSE